MSIVSANKKLAVSPFPDLSIKMDVKNGFGTAAHRHDLISAKVLFPGGDFVPGQTVYVRGDAISHAWAKSTYTLEGKEFILLPEELVVMVDLALPDKP